MAAPEDGADPDDPGDDLRRELLAAFESEYREHLVAMRSILQGGAVAGPALRDVFRRAHSLKGASRAVDLPRIEEIAHELETLLYRSVERDRPLSADDIAIVGRGLDSIESGMRGGLDAAPDAPDLPEPDAASRVSAREIDRLAETLQTASDAMVGQQQARQWLTGHETALRQVLELCATPGGTASDEIARTMRGLIRSTRARLRDRLFEDWQWEQAVSTMRAQIQSVALVSAESVFGPLGAMARALAREQGREIGMTLNGMAVLADRPVLQGLRDPVIQVLRNAVGHGLRGTDGGNLPEISLSVAFHGGELSVTVADDGPGPDLVAIARTARARGLLPEGGAAPDEATLLGLVFEPGFSTAAEVDRLSGRGMGLSIVAEAAARLGGTARMRRSGGRPGGGRGTVVAITVPLAARRQALLLVEAGGHLVGLPCGSVRRLISVRRGEIERVETGWAVRIGDGARLALRSLAGLLGGPEPVSGDTVPVVVLEGWGLMVERLSEVRTLVVRTPAIVGIDRVLVGGIAVVEGGRPIPVLEPDRLRTARAMAAAANPGHDRLGEAAGDGAGEPNAARAVAPAQATILVVDDSITTRTLEKTILQAQGYRVLIAVDGVEALALLRTAEWEIDVVVADVEMPRMDGFGLVAAMQADPRLSRIPAVLMTSRNQQSDVQRGLELGARAYLTKQDFEQGALLSVIRQLLP